jgi:hypothetical protein
MRLSKIASALMGVLIFLTLVNQAWASAPKCENLFLRDESPKTDLEIAKEFGADPQQNTIGRIHLSFSEADLIQEALAIRSAQPYSNGGDPTKAGAWIRSKKDMLAWKTPLTKAVFAQLMQMPEFRNEFGNKRNEAYVTLSVERTDADETSHNNSSPIWHADGGTFTPHNFKPYNQIIVLLYVNESNPTEFLSSSNSPELFNNLNSISKPKSDKNEEADALLKSWPDLQTFRLQSGQVIKVGSNTVHRRTIATRTAWRFFFRFDFQRP